MSEARRPRRQVTAQHGSQRIPAPKTTREGDGADCNGCGPLRPRRWRVKLHCENGLYPVRVVETKSRKDAVTLATEWAEREGFTVLDVRELERVWPTCPDDDEGPDDSRDPSVWPDGMGRLGWRY